MAHECPECGQVCYCNGDIEDMENQDWDNYVNCCHWKQCENEEADCLLYSPGDEYLLYIL